MATSRSTNCRKQKNGNDGNALNETNGNFGTYEISEEPARESIHRETNKGANGELSEKEGVNWPMSLQMSSRISPMNQMDQIANSPQRDTE